MTLVKLCDDHVQITGGRQPILVLVILERYVFAYATGISNGELCPRCEQFLSIDVLVEQQH